MKSFKVYKEVMSIHETTGMGDLEMSSSDKYEKIVDLAKRRGFFWPSYEIYGGTAGFYDLGPLGTRLMTKIMNEWRRVFIHEHQDMVVEIHTPVITPFPVFKASGHLDSFTDPIVECEKCGRKYRADHLVEEALNINAERLSLEELGELIRKHGIKCPACGGELSDVKTFNLLFETTIGPYSENKGFLRPETAQGIFVSFKRVYEAMRERLPLGIAQIGRVARNEISPRQGMIRLREFTIMEIEFFFDPEDPGITDSPIFDDKTRILTADMKLKGIEEPVETSFREALDKGWIMHPWLAYWMAIAQRFLISLGVPVENQFFEEKLPWERAHYSRQTFDQMVKVDRWGWIEVSGHAYRGDYDLSMHMKHSGSDLRVFKAYAEPREVVEKKISYNKALMGRMFKEKLPEILGELEKLDPNVVEKELREKGFIIVKGYKIDKNMVRVEEKTRKITGRFFVPHVVEPSFGLERLIYVVMEYAWREKEDRVILSIPRRIAPIEAAIYPLLAKKELVDKAKSIYKELLSEGFTVIYDETGSIGRRYARSDEIGVPAAITIDYKTLEDDTVTLRDRDNWRQIRVPVKKLSTVLRDFIYKSMSLEELVKRHSLVFEE